MVQAREIAAGRSFNLLLANRSPDAVGRPPAAAAALLYTAPGPAPLGPPAPVVILPICHDRFNHSIGPAAGPCLSVAHNPVPAIVSQRPSVLPVATTEVQCHHIGRIANIFHGVGFTVCRNCLNDIWAQPWAVEIRANVTRAPPALPAAPGGPQHPAVQHLTAHDAAQAGGGNVYRDFMTRMCKRCEDEEIRILVGLLNGLPTGMTVIPGGAFVTTKRSNLPTDRWPYVTCTCLEKYHENCTVNTDVCIQHRHREACAKHDELLIIRAQNDDWLRNLMRNRHGQVQQASGPARAGRIRSGLYRACRCGHDPSRTATPRVYQCLGCEGVIHMVVPPAPGGGPFVLPPRVSAKGGHHRDAVLAGAFSLRREI